MNTINRLLALASLMISLTVHAVDNPDAPDYLQNFRDEAAGYERMIQQEAITTSEIRAGYQDYIEFLERELAAAETAVVRELDANDQAAFVDATAAWQVYREAEVTLIGQVWVPRKFGTSSAISRPMFYTRLLKARIEQLQRYRMQF